MNQHNDTWSEKDEMRYIKNIGKHLQRPSNIPRIKLLKKYLLSILKRVNWENMNPATIWKFIQNEIKKEENKTCKKK